MLEHISGRTSRPRQSVPLATATRPKSTAGRSTTWPTGRSPAAPLAERPKEGNTAWAARLTDDERSQLAAWRVARRWHPHQLRHRFAAAVRATHGLEAAQILLGHPTVAASRISAERNVAAAIAVAAAIG